MNLESLITRVYQKYRISLSPDDPVFQILYLLIEQNLMIEQDKNKAISKQVDDVIAAAAIKLDNHIEAVKIANRETIQELLSNFDQLVEMKFDEKGSKPTNACENFLSNKPLWFYAAVLIFSNLASIAVVVLLLAST